MNKRTKLRLDRVVTYTREVTVADVAEDLGWSVHDVIESLESGDLAEALVDSTLLDGYDDGEEHKVTEL